MSDLLDHLLSVRPWLLADGATGTNLFARGLEHGEAPERWNLEAPEKIRAHYASFIEAGSDIVLTNTFGATANRLKLHALDDQVFEINRRAAELLREEIDAAGRPIVLAGDVGPTGDLFEPVGPLSHADGVAAFTAQMEGLKAGGADVLWIETMSSEEELAAALEAADAVGLRAIATLSFDTNGRTMMGVAPARLAEIAHTCDHPPCAFGGNCGTGASDLLAGLISAEAAITPQDVVVAKANAGVPEFRDGQVRYSGSVELMADYACLARDLGARIIGGCCGSTPAHIAAMRKALNDIPPGPRPTLDDVTGRLGPLTGATGDLFAAAAPAKRARRRGRG